MMAVRACAYANGAKRALPALRTGKNTFSASKGAGGNVRGFRRGLLALVLLLLVQAGLLLASPAARAAPQTAGATIAIISPDIGEPYRTLFNQVIAGIRSKAGNRITDFTVKPGDDVEKLKSELRRQGVKVVIALGREGMKFALALDPGTGVVVGSVIMGPETDTRNLPVYSLSPDPALLFARMKELMPATRRIFVVYDPRQNEWLVRQAKDAARAQGLELATYKAQDLRGAVRAYQDIFSSANGSRDALWLPQDSTTVEEGTVLPLVLHESWDHNIAVFSSNFGYVRRGVLFSLYPDNEAMGRHLATLAQDFLASGDYGERGMIMLHEVLMAINLRTARHLELDTSRQAGFDLVFPAQ